MEKHRAGAPLPRGPVADLWRNTLSQIPSLFGRLVYLSSLRDANSGRYEHHGLAMMFSPEEADRALRDSHDSAFQDWLNLSLEQQREDLDEYFSGLESERHVVLDAWTKLGSYRNILPESVRGMERELYLADLEALLTLLRRESGVAAPDPDA